MSGLPMPEFCPDLHDALSKSRRFLRAMTAEFASLSDDDLVVDFRAAMARVAERMSAADESAPTDGALIAWESLAVRLGTLPWSRMPEEP
jgi:hypothetical protein